MEIRATSQTTSGTCSVPFVKGAEEPRNHLLQKLSTPSEASWWPPSLSSFSRPDELLQADVHAPSCLHPGLHLSPGSSVSLRLLVPPWCCSSDEPIMDLISHQSSDQTSTMRALQTSKPGLFLQEKMGKDLRADWTSERPLS